MLLLFIYVLLLPKACTSTATIMDFKTVNIEETNWLEPVDEGISTKIRVAVVCSLQEGQDGKCNAFSCQDGKRCESGVPKNCSHILGRSQSGAVPIAYNKARYREVLSPRVIFFGDSNTVQDFHIDAEYESCTTETVRVADLSDLENVERRAVLFRDRVLACSFWVNLDCVSYKIGEDSYRYEAAPLSMHKQGGFTSFLGDMTVMAVSGVADDGYTDQAEVFDGVRWRRVAPLPSMKGSAAVVSISEHEMLHIGGFFTGFTDETRVFRYDLQEDKWHVQDSLNVGWRGANCAYVESFQGRRSVVCVMGDTGDALTAGIVQVYDILDDAWTMLAEDISGGHRKKGVTFVHHNKLFVVGGKTVGVNSVTLDVVSSLDLSSLQWTELGSLAQAGDYESLVVAWQKLLIEN